MGTLLHARTSHTYKRTKQKARSTHIQTHEAHTHMAHTKQKARSTHIQTHKAHTHSTHKAKNTKHTHSTHKAKNTKHTHSKHTEHTQSTKHTKHTAQACAPPPWQQPDRPACIGPPCTRLHPRMHWVPLLLAGAGCAPPDPKPQLSPPGKDRTHPMLPEPHSLLRVTPCWGCTPSSCLLAASLAECAQVPFLAGHQGRQPGHQPGVSSAR